MSKIRCGKCRSIIEESDVVYLDVINTVVHVNCEGGNVKDAGVFKEIMDKYSYLK